jgi:hypothetical protein
LCSQGIAASKTLGFVSALSSCPTPVCSRAINDHGSGSQASKIRNSSALFALQLVARQVCGKLCDVDF